eukprot:EG_transcript_5178
MSFHEAPPRTAAPPDGGKGPPATAAAAEALEGIRAKVLTVEQQNAALAAALTAVEAQLCQVREQLAAQPVAASALAPTTTSAAPTRETHSSPESPTSDCEGRPLLGGWAGPSTPCDFGHSSGEEEDILDPVVIARKRERVERRRRIVRSELEGVMRQRASWAQRHQPDQRDERAPPTPPRPEPPQRSEALGDAGTAVFFAPSVPIACAPDPRHGPAFGVKLRDPTSFEPVVVTLGLLVHLKHCFLAVEQPLPGRIAVLHLFAWAHGADQSPGTASTVAALLAEGGLRGSTITFWEYLALEVYLFLGLERFSWPHWLGYMVGQDVGGQAVPHGDPATSWRRLPPRQLSVLRSKPPDPDPWGVQHLYTAPPRPISGPPRPIQAVLPPPPPSRLVGGAPLRPGSAPILWPPRPSPLRPDGAHAVGGLLAQARPASAWYSLPSVR